MSVDPTKFYRVRGDSLQTIGNFMREAAGGRAPADIRSRQEFRRRVFEGVLLEDLPQAESINQPKKADFQIKSMIEGSDALSNDGVIKVLKRSRFAAFQAGDYGFAFEMYPDVFYWVPMDCSNPMSSSSSSLSSFFM